MARSINILLITLKLYSSFQNFQNFPSREQNNILFCLNLVVSCCAIGSKKLRGFWNRQLVSIVLWCALWFWGGSLWTVYSNMKDESFVRWFGGEQWVIAEISLTHNFFVSHTFRKVADCEGDHLDKKQVNFVHTIQIKLETSNDMFTVSFAQDQGCTCFKTMLEEIIYK